MRYHVSYMHANSPGFGRGFVDSRERRGMYCRDCEGLQERRDADGLTHHTCCYTGVTVYPLVLAPGADKRDKATPHEADEPRALCPRNLEPMSDSGNALVKAMVCGVLWQVQERGELDALLATYPADIADKLAQILEAGKVRAAMPAGSVYEIGSA